MSPRHLALILVGIMLLAPAICFTDSLVESNEMKSTSSRSSNNALLWGAHVAGSSSTDSVMGIEMDALGRTYVCGYFYNTATFGNFTLSAYGSYDIFVGRLSNGVWDWVEKAGTTSSDQCKDIAVDDGGNVTITGDDLCFTLPTGPATTQAFDRGSRCLDRFKQALFRPDRDINPGLCQMHGKGFTHWRREEMFEMNMCCWPTKPGGCFDHSFDHAFGPADINMGAKRLIR